MAMRGPQHVFVLVLSSGFRCMHVLPIAFITQAAFRYRPNYLTNKARGRVITSKILQTSPYIRTGSSSSSSSCFRGTQQKGTCGQWQHQHGVCVCVVSSDRTLCTYMLHCIPVSSGISIIDPRPTAPRCPTNKARADDFLFLLFILYIYAIIFYEYIILYM